MKKKFLIVLVNIAISIAIVVVAFGILGVWYIIDDGAYCRKHERANLNIEFEWSFSGGCMFELPDGTWVNLREYKNRNEFKIEVEK